MRILARCTYLLWWEIICDLCDLPLQKTGAYSSLLSIGRADPRLNGNYTCTASNAAATAHHTASLHVEGILMSLFSYIDFWLYMELLTHQPISIIISSPDSAVAPLHDFSDHVRPQNWQGDTGVFYHLCKSHVLLGRLPGGRFHCGLPGCYTVRQGPFRGRLQLVIIARYETRFFCQINAIVIMCHGFLHAFHRLHFFVFNLVFGF